MTTFTSVKPKSIFKTETFWGIAVGALTNLGPYVAQLVGFDFSAADADTAAQVVNGVATSIGNAISFALVLYGRWKAGKATVPVAMSGNAAPVSVEIRKDASVSTK